MALSPEQQKSINRQNNLMKLGLFGTAVVGASENRNIHRAPKVIMENGEKKTVPKEQNPEFLTQLLYLEMVARLSHLKKHLIATNAIVQMNTYVDVVIKEGPFATTSEEASKRAAAHAEGFGHDRAQFLMLEELYRFVSLVIEEFPDSTDEFLPFQIGLLTLVQQVESERSDDSFSWIHQIRRAKTAEEKDSLYQQYLERAKQNPGTTQDERAAVARIAGKDTSLKSKLTRAYTAFAHNLRQKQRPLIESMRERFPRITTIIDRLRKMGEPGFSEPTESEGLFSLDGVKKILTLRFVGLSKDDVREIPVTTASEPEYSQSHE